MKLSFTWKLGIVVALLSLALTGGSFYWFYVVSSGALTRQIGKNLLSVGRLGALLFDDEAREAIKRLTAATEKDSIVDAGQIAAMPSGTTMLSLSPEDMERYHGSADFQILLKILRRIFLATVRDMEPRNTTDTYDELAQEPMRLMNDGALGVYLAVSVKESPSHEVNKYLASAMPFPAADGWPGNPIGNLTRGWTPPASVFAGKPYVDDRLYTDSFYTSISAVVPLLNADGSFLACLGIDYAATKKKNVLILLQYISFGLMVGGLLLTAIIAFYTARRLGASLRQLSDAAQRVAASDLTVVLDIRSNDEFAMVGRVFNRMIAGIRHAISVLDTKQSQLAAIIWYMHDRVGAILTALAAESEKEGGATGDAGREATGCLPTIHQLGRDGLTEVRFLMNALDYDHCDWSVLIEEIRMQGADLLAPAGVLLDLVTLADGDRTALDFQEFLVLQRIFREIFTALGTGKKGSVCTITMDFSGVETVMEILAPDHNRGRSGSSDDRDLSYLIAEAASYGWRMEFVLFQEGFHLRLHIPSPLLGHKTDGVGQGE